MLELYIDLHRKDTQGDGVTRWRVRGEAVHVMQRRGSARDAPRQHGEKLSHIAREGVALHQGMRNFLATSRAIVTEESQLWLFSMRGGLQQAAQKLRAGRHASKGKSYPALYTTFKMKHPDGCPLATASAYTMLSPPLCIELLAPGLVVSASDLCST